MADKQKYVGVVEIKQPNGEYFYVEVFKDGNKLITGTFANAIFLRDEWTVDINDYCSLQEAIEDLYDMLYDAAMQEVADCMKMTKYIYESNCSGVGFN